MNITGLLLNHSVWLFFLENKRRKREISILWVSVFTSQNIYTPNLRISMQFFSPKVCNSKNGMKWKWLHFKASQLFIHVNVFKLIALLSDWKARMALESRANERERKVKKTTPTSCNKFSIWLSAHTHTRKPHSCTCSLFHALMFRNLVLDRVLIESNNLNFNCLWT